MGQIKRIKSIRKFEGKTYSYTSTFTTKRDADRYAKNARARGFNARILKGKFSSKHGHDHYRVYTRLRLKSKRK